MKNKIIIMLVAILFALTTASLSMADTTDITGQFTPTSSVSATLWNTTMDWGSLGTSAVSQLTTQINNTGDTNIDITIKYKDTTTDLTLVAGAPVADQYRIEQNGSGSWTDVTVGYTTVKTNLATSSVHPFDIRATMGSSFTQDWGVQYHNNTVQYVAHT